jgi:hypothetical protein
MPGACEAPVSAMRAARADAFSRRLRVPCDRDAAPLGAPLRLFSRGRSVCEVAWRNAFAGTVPAPQSWLRATQPGNRSRLYLQDRLRKAPLVSQDSIMITVL